MIDKEKLQSAIEFARDQGLPWIEIDGVKMPVPPKAEPQIEITEEAMKALYAQEPEYTDEELLYFATPYFDELQEQKRIRQEQLKTQEALNG